jgi:hypothetical protein
MTSRVRHQVTADVHLLLLDDDRVLFGHLIPYCRTALEHIAAAGGRAGAYARG